MTTCLLSSVVRPQYRGIDPGPHKDFWDVPMDRLALPEVVARPPVREGKVKNGVDRCDAQAGRATRASADADHNRARDKRRAARPTSAASLGAVITHL